jgi:glycosyltransferase involved in cell wall biosynthesis
MSATAHACGKEEHDPPPILSVILPTYNVERFVEDCIRSVESQDIDQRRYEVIVVDDGATDGSIDRVLELQREYENIVVLRQPNAGLSAARNRGIRAAKGKYLLFVDTDDRVEANCFGKMLSTAESHPDIDFVGFSYVIHLNSGLVTIPECPTPGVDPINGIEYYAKFVASDYHVWRYLFSRRFLLRHELFFLEGISFEDAELIPRLMCMARSAIFFDLPFYHYYLRPGSISTSKSEKHIYSRIAAAENLHRFGLEKASVLDADARVILDDVIAECLLAAVSSAHRFPRRLADLSSRIRRLPFYPMALSERSKHRWEGRILNSSIGLFWAYSCALSFFRTTRTKAATLLSIANGPTPIKKLLGYCLTTTRLK